MKNTLQCNPMVGLLLALAPISFLALKSNVDQASPINKHHAYELQVIWHEGYLWEGCGLATQGNRS